MARPFHPDAGKAMVLTVFLAAWFIFITTWVVVLFVSAFSNVRDFGFFSGIMATSLFFVILTSYGSAFISKWLYRREEKRK